MELKCGWETINGQTAQSSNRTFMELKLPLSHALASGR